MDMVSFDPNTLVWWLVPLAVIALVTACLLVAVAVDAVTRHHSTRVASRQTLSGYYGNLFHLPGAHAAH